jgi:hypothetical protein
MCKPKCNCLCRTPNRVVNSPSSPVSTLKKGGRQEKAKKEEPLKTIKLQPIKFSLVPSHSRFANIYDDDVQSERQLPEKRTVFEKHLRSKKKEIYNPLNVSDYVPKPPILTQINRKGALFMKYVDYLHKKRELL